MQFTDSQYKYGFVTEIETNRFPHGLSEEIVRQISRYRNENESMLDFRLNAYRKWIEMQEPKWANLKYTSPNFNAMRYYAEPKSKPKLRDLSEVDPQLLETFRRLGIPLEEQKRLANVAIDVVFDSVSLGVTWKEPLEREGIIFCSIGEAIEKYPDLVLKYLGTVVPPGDNFYAALNSAVFSDGSFVYIPKGVKSPLELSTYFRINDKETGQFERTLIIAEEDSFVSYLEGCTAPAYSVHQYHAAVVEIVVFNDAEVKYSTVQNWYSGDRESGNGGVYNFVTKRGICQGDRSKIVWVQVEVGAAVTWKYPSCILVGDDSVGEFYSVALTNGHMQADTGTKMIHKGARTRSTIISKGISADSSSNTYRGMVSISQKAKEARNYTQCDSMLVGDRCSANTFPSVDVNRFDAIVEHEASTSKISDEQLFYLQSRGIGKQESIQLMVNGFCRNVLDIVPMEFAIEAKTLLALKLEGTIG